MSITHHAPDKSVLAAFDDFIARAVESARESLRRDPLLLPRVVIRGADGRESTLLVDELFYFEAAVPNYGTTPPIDLENSQMYLAMTKMTVDHESAKSMIIAHAYHRNGSECTLAVPFCHIHGSVVFQDEERTELPPYLKIGIFANPYRRLLRQNRSFWLRTRLFCIEIGKAICWRIRLLPYTWPMLAVACRRLGRLSNLCLRTRSANPPRTHACRNRANSAQS